MEAIIRVGMQEITIGRTASAGEEPLEAVIDYAVNAKIGWIRTLAGVYDRNDGSRY